MMHVFYFIIILEYDHYADLLVDTDFQTDQTKLNFLSRKKFFKKILPPPTILLIGLFNR